MMTRSILGAISLVAAAGLFVASCSSLPTAPDLAPGGSASLRIAVDPEPTPAPDPTPAPAPTPEATPVSASRSVFVRAALGGTVAAGNFKVVIPPLALKADAIVTVRQPDVTKPEVELGITPEDRNGFRLPVLLVADASAMDHKLLSLATIGWWNPATSRWEPVAGASVNLLGLTVQAPLMHFSKYRVEQGGKAGW